MTHEREIERLLDTWFSDGPTETPDRVIDTVADRIARQPQRPAWRLTWRHHPLNAYLKPLALVAATILVAFLGFNLVGGLKTTSDVAAPSPTPSATPSLSPSPAASSSPLASSAAYACDRGKTCSGLLPAGDHTTRSFSVPFSFTTPEGWVNRADIGHAYVVDTGVGIAAPISVLSKIVIVEQTPACSPTAKSGAGDSVQDIVDLVRTHPGLDASDPVAVEIGGYRGQSIDFTVAPSWTTFCSNLDDTGAFVLLLTDSGVPAVQNVGYTAAQLVRWDVIDVSGETVIIERVTSSYGGKFEEAAAAAQPIIDSIRFTPPN